MSKKMINMNARAETVLSSVRENGGNLSSFVSDAVMNFVLPQYGILHTEGLYLLDTITNDLSDWRGPGGSRIVPEDPSQAALTAVRRSVSWLRSNHIRNAAVLKMILSHFDISEDTVYSGSDHRIDEMIATFSLQMGLSDVPGLGTLGKAMLASWDSVWDDTDAYEVIIKLIYLNDPSVPFTPFEALDIMRMIEQTYILQHICE